MSLTQIGELMHKRKQASIIIILILMFTTFLNVASFAVEDHLERPRVLVLRSLDDLRFDVKFIMNGFQKILKTQEVEMNIVDIHDDYLDDPGYRDGIGTMVQAMVENGGDYDLLILIRESAVRYALEKDEIFQSMPVIFSMVENESLSADVHKTFDAVEVSESVLLRENILLAQAMRDRLTDVLVLTDEGIKDTGIETELIKQAQLFTGTTKVSFADSSGIISGAETMPDLSPENTMIYYLSEHHSENALSSVRDEGYIVLTPWVNLIKGRVDGGRVINSEQYGELIGIRALEILDGKRPSELERENVASKYVFDYIHVMDKQLDLRWVENEVHFLNKESSSESSWTILAGIVLLLVAVVVAIVLTVKHYLEHHQQQSDAVSPFADEIMTNVDTAITIKDEDRKYIHVNSKFLDLFGIQRDVVGLTDAQVFPADFAVELKSIDDRATFGSDDYDKKIIYNHMSSGALYLEFKVKKVKDTDGKIHLVSYVNDLTEQKKHEKTLAELNHLLEQQVRDRTGELIQAEKMAILGTLVAGVSHEISTPIGVSITASTFLSDQTNHLKKQFEEGALKKSDMVSFLELLDETGEILFNNLNNAAEMITNFKKVAVDQASEEIREFNLKDYSRGVVMNLKPKFKHTKHKIHVLGDEDLKLYSYPGAVNQILTNLILNSLIHGFENKEEGEIKIMVQERPELMGVRIEYTDNGQGIPKETVSKVFDPFYTTKRGKGGSGLGMNIVRNLVEKTLGGSIKAYSDTGEGVRFVLDFPKRINVYEKSGGEA